MALGSQTLEDKAEGGAEHLLKSQPKVEIQTIQPTSHLNRDRAFGYTQAGSCKLQ